ncbi:MAG: hypothetical protein D6754_12010 [Alphaproteobacteria bacterium]|nr:MAG: hypothetical protein D6754_12010 [Alphaproteobacteria bacterium]
MITSVPDILSGLHRQQNNFALRQRLETASQELASGRKSDLIEASGGDLARLHAIEAGLSRLTAGADRLKMAEGRAGMTQEALGRFADAAGAHGAALLGDVGLGDVASARTRAAGARSAFEAAVNAINTRYAGRSLFAGAATDTDALAPPDQILSEVSAAIAGAPDVPTALAAIDFYFNDPAGGFATSAFQGAAIDAPDVDLGDGQRLSYAERGDSAAVREMLQGLATLVMGNESALGQASSLNEMAFYRDGATRVVSAQDAVTDARALLGVAEARIADAATANAAEASALDLMRSRLLARDPYEAASEFQALESQMQSLYAATARLAGLSLTNYLR